MSAESCSILIFIPLEFVVVQLFFLILISDFPSFFSSIFSKGRKHFHQARRLGANIFQRPQTFSSSAKVGREHFSKATNIFIKREGWARTFFKGRKRFHQAQRLGANIFQRPQTFLIKRKGWARTFFKGREHFSSGAKVWRKHFSKSAHFFISKQTIHEAPKVSSFPSLIGSSSVKYARSKAKF
jgi:hypothetical protein